MVSEEEIGEEKADSQNEATDKDKDLVAKLMALTKALAGLPTSTIDAAVRQLLEERILNSLRLRRNLERTGEPKGE